VNDIQRDASSTRPLSLTQDGIPFYPRTCFNWLPQYRYGLMAHKALQRACQASLSALGDRCAFDVNGREKGESPYPIHCVRPALMDSVLRTKELTGFVMGQSEGVLHEFTNGERYFPLSEDLALIVAKEDGSAPLLNNILSYMTPAPASLSALFALSGGYCNVSADDLADACRNRRLAAGELCRYISAMYQVNRPDRIRLHAAGVGGLIEAATRYMHFRSPGYRTCLFVPEYWDLLRCVLTYSPRNVRIVEGRDERQPSPQRWLSELAQPGLDFAYTSVTSNPLGSSLPRSVLLEAIDSVSDDTLFFLDFTSVDIHETFDQSVLTSILRTFPKKNLMITKSFAKDYNRGHLRVGYALFTRSETAEGIWPYMAAYPPATVSREILDCLKSGNQEILKEYRRLNRLLEDSAAAHPEIHVAGSSSNYTSVYFESEEACVRMKDALEREQGPKVFPGELPMQGGGALGLNEGEINLTTMKRIPFLSPRALRLLVTDRSIGEFFGLLANI
jgi:histidinol-phosphate/aromatic aminotransferase/cobyric acid decarboxylase-like protein